jgi:hypothetical protein
MALVRCTCIATVTVGEDGAALAVTVPDPSCAYRPHRLLSGDLSEGLAAER